MHILKGCVGLFKTEKDWVTEPKERGKLLLGWMEKVGAVGWAQGMWMNSNANQKVWVKENNWNWPWIKGGNG